MNNMLKAKIMDLMKRSDFMTLSTSVAGNSSAANVYFSNDGLDIYFFTFTGWRHYRSRGQFSQPKLKIF